MSCLHIFLRYVHSALLYLSVVSDVDTSRPRAKHFWNHKCGYSAISCQALLTRVHCAKSRRERYSNMAKATLYGMGLPKPFSSSSFSFSPKRLQSPGGGTKAHFEVLTELLTSGIVIFELRLKMEPDRPILLRPAAAAGTLPLLPSLTSLEFFGESSAAEVAPLPVVATTVGFFFKEFRLKMLRRWNPDFERLAGARLGPSDGVSGVAMSCPSLRGVLQTLIPPVLAALDREGNLKSCSDFSDLSSDSFSSLGSLVSLSVLTSSPSIKGDDDDDVIVGSDSVGSFDVVVDSCVTVVSFLFFFFVFVSLSSSLLLSLLTSFPFSLLLVLFSFEVDSVGIVVDDEDDDIVSLRFFFFVFVCVSSSVLSLVFFFFFLLSFSFSLSSFV